MRIDNNDNRRILVVDDEEAIRDSFRLVLCPPEKNTDQVDAAAAALFDDEPAAATNVPSKSEFKVDFATNGREALDRVQQSLTDEMPYAVVFCDMRMPGWDGLETVQHIREADPRCEIVFVTAYSDQDVESVVRQVGGDVGYFLKPFANEELRQMAVKGVLEWNRARELEKLFRAVTSMRGEVEDIDRLLQYLLRQLCEWLGTESAALVQVAENGSLQTRLGVGRLARGESNEAILQEIADRCHDKPCRLEDGTTYLPIKEYGLAIAMDCKDAMTPDKEYLLRFFLEHASMAIRNSEMQSKLMKAEQLAAVGQAIGFIVHDLRSPLGNIQDLTQAIDDPDDFGLTTDEIKEFMSRAVNLTMELLNDILEFSRGTTKVEPVEGQWSDLIGRNLELVRRDLEKQNVTLIVDAPDDLRLYVDGNRMFRVLRNLCKNASEAFGSRHSDAEVRVGAAAGDGVTEIWVADNGSGLPPEVQEKMFQPFMTKAKVGGTGFGLAIAKQLVDAHGGTIEVESSDAGTKFTIKVPNHR